MPGPINHDIQTQKSVDAQLAAQQVAQTNTQQDAPIMQDKKDIQAAVEATSRSTFQRSDWSTALRQQNSGGGRARGCALPGG